MTTTKKKKDPGYDPLKVISQKLSRRGRRPKDKTVEKLLAALEAGEYKSKSGTYKLSGPRSLEYVVKVIKLGASPREVSWKVSQRFDWQSVQKEIREYATSQGVDPALVKQALIGRQQPRAAKRKTS